MYNLYLPYEVSFDVESQTYCCTGLDREEEIFGTGSGATLELAEQRLREAVFESLFTDASDGNDYTSSLYRTLKGDQCLMLTAVELLPIRIRLARTARRLKQSEVAERMGISQQAYSKLERTGANPTFALLSRLEVALQQEILQLT
jgi:DNA-binding XRE family transcriptional regulator